MFCVHRLIVASEICSQIKQNVHVHLLHRNRSMLVVRKQYVYLLCIGISRRILYRIDLAIHFLIEFGRRRVL